MSASPRRLCAAIVSLMCILVPATSAAVIIDFDFDGVTPATPSKVFVDAASGVTLTVTALYREPAGFLPALVTQRANGLGVLSPGEAGGEGELDSFGANEALIWSIAGVPGLRLERILFGNFEAGSDFELYTDISGPADLIGPGLIPGPPAAFNPANPWSPADDGLDIVAHSTLAMKVNLAGGPEAFRISAMRFSTVPEPLSAALVVPAALIAWRQRRRRT